MKRDSQVKKSLYWPEKVKSDRENRLRIACIPSHSNFGSLTDSVLFVLVLV